MHHVVFPAANRASARFGLEAARKPAVSAGDARTRVTTRITLSLATG